MSIVAMSQSRAGGVAHWVKYFHEMRRNEMENCACPASRAGRTGTVSRLPAPVSLH